MVNTNLDTTPLPPTNLVAKDPESAELAGYVRTKTFGRDVRESIARSIELNSTRSKSAEILASETLKVTETATRNMANQVELIRAEKDAVIANATVDSEVILARGGKDTLGQRLDETDAQLAESRQKDIVALINRLTEYDKVNVMRKSGTTDLSVVYQKNKDAIVWVMEKNSYDDFLQLGSCYSGRIRINETLKEYKVYTPIQLTLIESTDPFKYTATVGDKMSVTFTGTGIDFRFVKQVNGGVWRFTLQETGAIKDVDTWNATTTTGRSESLFRELTPGTYTVVGEFIGAGPNTTSPPRGWLDYQQTFAIYEAVGSEYVEKVDDLLVGFSNKELALQMKPFGTPITPRYTPMHSGIGTTFNRLPRKILVDGNEVTDVTAYASDVLCPVNDIVFIQKMRAKLPDYANDLVEFDTTHTFSKNGNVEVVGKLKVLEKIDVVELFTFMIPGDKDVLDRVITSKGNEYAATKIDGSITDMTAQEGKTTTSYAFLSDSNDYIIAGRINDPQNTMLLDVDIDTSLYREAWIQHRDATMTKIYTYAIRDGVLDAGDVVRFNQTFNCAKVPNISSLL